MSDAPRFPATIAFALSAARTAVPAVPMNGKGFDNGRVYSYALCDDLIRAGESALRGVGLHVVSMSQILEAHGDILFLQRRWLLCHQSGESVSMGPTLWPIHHKGGKALDKAHATALTESTARFYRDLLVMERSPGVATSGESMEADRDVKPAPAPLVEMRFSCAACGSEHCPGCTGRDEPDPLLDSDVKPAKKTSAAQLAVQKEARRKESDALVRKERGDPVLTPEQEVAAMQVEAAEAPVFGGPHVDKEPEIPPTVDLVAKLGGALDHTAKLHQGGRTDPPASSPTPGEGVTTKDATGSRVTPSGSSPAPGTSPGAGPHKEVAPAEATEVAPAVASARGVEIKDGTRRDGPDGPEFRWRGRWCPVTDSAPRAEAAPADLCTVHVIGPGPLSAGLVGQPTRLIVPAKAGHGRTDVPHDEEGNWRDGGPWCHPCTEARRDGDPLFGLPFARDVAPIGRYAIRLAGSNTVWAATSDLAEAGAYHRLAIDRGYGPTGVWVEDRDDPIGVDSYRNATSEATRALEAKAPGADDTVSTPAGATATNDEKESAETDPDRDSPGATGGDNKPVASGGSVARRAHRCPDCLADLPLAQHGTPLGVGDDAWNCEKCSTRLRYMETDGPAWVEAYLLSGDLEHVPTGRMVRRKSRIGRKLFVFVVETKQEDTVDVTEVRLWLDAADRKALSQPTAGEVAAAGAAASSAVAKKAKPPRPPKETPPPVEIPHDDAARKELGAKWLAFKFHRATKKPAGPCALCPGQVALGQRYRAGKAPWPGRVAHDLCVGRLVEGKDPRLEAMALGRAS